MVGYQRGKQEERAEEFLLGGGARPRVVFRSNDNGTVQAMVAAGLGFALAPLLAVDETAPRVRVLQLAEPMPPRVLIIVWHRDRYRAPASAAFVETAVAVAARIAPAREAVLTTALRLYRGRGARRPAPNRRPQHSPSRPAGNRGCA